jgi:hypothetical protein
MYFDSEYRINFHSSFIIVKHWQLNQIFYVINSCVGVCCQASLRWMFPVDVFHLPFFYASSGFDYSLYELLTALFSPYHYGKRYTACKSRSGILPAYVLWPNWPFRRSAFSNHLFWRLLFTLRSFLPKGEGVKLCCLHIHPVISRDAYFK